MRGLPAFLGENMSDPRAITLRPLKPLFGVVREVHFAAIAEPDGSVKLVQTAIGNTQSMYLSPAQARQVAGVLLSAADAADPN